MTWGETLDSQKSSLRWDIKRTIKILCKQLSDIGEECFVVTCNINNGWVSHLGSVYGDDFINEHCYIPYRFLDFCRESVDIIDPSDANLNQAVPTNNPADLDDGNQIRIEMMPDVSDDEEIYEMVPIKDEDVKDEPLGLEAVAEMRLQQQHTDVFPKQQDYASPKQHKNDSRKPHKSGIRRKSATDSQKKHAGIGIKLPFRSPLKKYKSDRMMGLRRPSITSPLKRQIQRKEPKFVKTRIVHSCALCNQTFKHDNNYVKHILGERHQNNLHRNIVCYKCKNEFDSYLELYHHVTLCKGKKQKGADKPVNNTADNSI